MAIQRRWILPLGALAAVGLTLWGIYGVGTAGTLLPEKKADASRWKCFRKKRMASP